MADFGFVRNFALSLPNARERSCYGTPAFYVGRTLFARFLNDGDSIVVKIDERDRERRMAADPQVFSVTDHYLNYPMMIVRLSAVDDDDLQELLRDACKVAAS
ncbi:MAG: MmcQ/YjbR family DNA-binding protein [Planctomycetaceae bacterium]|nr:MmcQ/YjbR family DNA-binding protein [Planctomycetales bacterium]MCB9921447.1 MmcQ/YjbR family DNA-binding protein [Planctomycetaceae bacterium]